MASTNFSFSENKETEKREREIYLLIRIQEPDPEYDPIFISDEATIFDVIMTDEGMINQKFKDHFGKDFSFDLSQPLWKLVDKIKHHYPDWPKKDQ